MITNLQALEEIIKQAPFLEEGLAMGIINLSALGRHLKPRVEKRLYKKTSEAALVMALKRLGPKIKKKRGNVGELKKLRNLTVRSDLIEYALRNPGSLPLLYKQLLQKIDRGNEVFINFSQGVSETTLIVSSGLKNKVESIIPKDLIMAKIPELASLTLNLPAEHLYVPGVQYALLKALAWENINVIETISAYSEITIIVEQKNIERAFACIKTITDRD